MKKLVCDRCGKELTDKYDIELALEGQPAWAAAARGSGDEPRGIIPCENFVRCRGEMQLLERQGEFLSRRQSQLKKATLKPASILMLLTKRKN